MILDDEAKAALERIAEAAALGHITLHEIQGMILHLIAGAESGDVRVCICDNDWSTTPRTTPLVISAVDAIGTSGGTGYRSRTGRGGSCAPVGSERQSCAPVGSERHDPQD